MEQLEVICSPHTPKDEVFLWFLATVKSKLVNSFLYKSYL